MLFLVSLNLCLFITAVTSTYISLEVNINECPSGYGRVTSAEDCDSAGEDLGMGTTGHSGANCDWPQGCMWHIGGQTQFNNCQDGVGSPHPNYHLVCKVKACDSDSECPTEETCYESKCETCDALISATACSQCTGYVWTGSACALSCSSATDCPKSFYGCDELACKECTLIRTAEHCPAGMCTWTGSSCQRSYELRDTGSCAGEVTTIAACGSAAALLGLADTTASSDGQTTASLEDPPYCYHESSSLKFNEGGTNTGICTTYRKCICKVECSSDSDCPPQYACDNNSCKDQSWDPTMYNYVSLSQGDNECPSGFARLPSPRDCAAASDALGITWNGWVQSDCATKPKGCHWHIGGRTEFNTCNDGVGTGGANYQLICRELKTTTVTTVITTTSSNQLTVSMTSSKHGAWVCIALVLTVSAML